MTRHERMYEHLIEQLKAKVAALETAMREIDASFTTQCDSVDPDAIARHVKDELRKFEGQKIALEGALECERRLFSLSEDRVVALEIDNTELDRKLVEARGNTRLVMASRDEIHAKVAALEKENAALREAAEPRSMDSPPDAGSEVLAVFRRRYIGDDLWELKASRIIGWFPISPPATDTAKESE